MCDKSYVSMERRICHVCAKEYDTNSILLDRRLRPSLNRRTTTGWGLCPEHQKLYDDGFIALIECDPTKSGKPSNGVLGQGQAYRTGRVAHLKREAFGRVFDVPLQSGVPCVFVDPEVIDRLQAMTQTSGDQPGFAAID